MWSCSGRLVQTALAIHRTAYVPDERADHGGRTLLVTFNQAAHHVP
jgi:hypothetical protein